MRAWQGLGRAEDPEFWAVTKNPGSSENQSADVPPGEAEAVRRRESTTLESRMSQFVCQDTRIMLMMTKGKLRDCSRMDQQVVNVRFYTDFPICNFKCPYCVVGHSLPGGRHESPWDEQRYFKIIDNMTQLPFKINVRIGVGGEFFISKKLVEGARRLSHADCVVGLNLITNLSFSSAQYARILDGFIPSKIAIVASFHPSEVRDMDAWIKVARDLADRYDFMTMAVAYPPFLGSMKEIRRKFTEAGIECFIYSYVGVYNGLSYPQSYSDDERKLIREVIYSRHDYEYAVNLRRPGLCHAGHRSFYVDPYGKVFPCGIGPYDRSLGDLSRSPEIRLAGGPRPCPFPSCRCDTENINTVDFGLHYVRPGLNQHRHHYRFAEEAQDHPWMDEWTIRY